VQEDRVGRPFILVIIPGNKGVSQPRSKLGKMKGPKKAVFTRNCGCWFFIFIHGPDALKALQGVYVSNMAKVAEGRVKYSAMCNDDGCVIDDGVVVKLAENDYYFTTSTARAGETVEWFRFHTRYDGWDFHLVNLTDAMGVINISGPNARQVLVKVADTDLSNETFPYGSYREFTIRKKIPVRAMRLGFVGELSYELHADASYMPALWQIIEEAGQEFGIRNFGVEAQNVLRLEKCHIILGQESEQPARSGAGLSVASQQTRRQDSGRRGLAPGREQSGPFPTGGLQDGGSPASAQRRLDYRRPAHPRVCVYLPQEFCPA